MKNLIIIAGITVIIILLLRNRNKTIATTLRVTPNGVNENVPAPSEIINHVHNAPVPTSHPFV